MTPEEIAALAAADRGVGDMRDPRKSTLAELRATLAEFIADHLDIVPVRNKPDKCILRVKAGFNCYEVEKRFDELQSMISVAEAESSK